MTRFDPLQLAAACRSGRLYPPRRDDLARFGAHGAWQAGTEALRTALAGWWVGESGRVAPILDDAVEWLESPEGSGRPWGDPALFHEARHRHAHALAGWMTGRDEPASWAKAAETFDVAHMGRSLEAPQALERALLRAMAGHPSEAAAEAVGALQSGDAQRIAASLAPTLAQMLRGDPGLAETSLMAFAFGRVGGVARPRCCPLFAYVLLPSLPLPPALVERGWSDAMEARVSLASPFAAFARMLTPLGLARDPDAEAQPPLPRFASWTRHPTLDLEVDWHAPEGETAWVEIRGESAGRLAAVLAEVLDGKQAPQPEAALAELLTVPPTIRSPANGRVRWEILTATLGAVPAADRAAVLPLVAAGLADTDWRVRMVAVWGAGALAFESLATAVAKAPLPPIEETGLNAEDRRALLALRDAAVLRASARQPEAATHAGSGPGGARRAGFVQRIAALLDEIPIPPQDRHEALIAALLRRPGLDEKTIPRAWRSWIGRERPSHGASERPSSDSMR